MTGQVEADVGMSEYIGKHNGFSAILKLRYQDFLVNEIDKKGNLLQLRDFEYKEEVIDSSEKEEEQEIETGILSNEEEESLKKLMKEESASSVLINAGQDKSRRTKIHQFIRQCYPKLDSKTIIDANSSDRKIEVTKKDNGRKRKFDRSRKERIIIRFLLYKENVSTMDAVNLIMKKLHLKHSSSFQYAGNKDKRGVTVQEMTTSLPIHRILPINKMFKNIKVGNFSRCKSALQLGDLTGNHFSIVLRDVKDATKKKITAAVTSFKTVGFINYFGMQRFGTSQVSTYKVGMALLMSKWAEAIDYILSSATEENTDTLALIKSWKKNGNAEAAYKKLQKQSSFEGFLLQGIAQFGTKQLVQALGRIPRTTRLLYLHSYQSYVWNRVVSRRIREFGTSPVAGDLVLLNEDKCNEETEDNVNDSEQRTKKPKLSDNAQISFENQKKALPGVKILKKSDLSSYNMTDVVMPLPGYRVIYPKNAASWYKEIFLQDNIDMSCFDHKVKEYSLAGAYRKIVVRPGNVEWDLVTYDDFKEPLLLSDHDRMCGKHEPLLQETGDFKALRIHFDLPSSSYATVAVRELLKSDMSITTQSDRGQVHKKAVEVAS